jgi:hypothetical protein
VSDPTGARSSADVYHCAATAWAVSGGRRRSAYSVEFSRSDETTCAAAAASGGGAASFFFSEADGRTSSAS